ncbi:MAG: outer membrane lipoprotein-sorting protein [bacterium]|nr:outer membrane lipoprotein-sorting protein [bacterium]
MYKHVIAIIILATTASVALTGQEIAEKAYEASKADDDKIQEFTCKLTHDVADKDGDEMNRVVGNLYYKEPDMDHFEILEFYKDGKKEDIPDDDDEDKEELEIKFPFDEDYFDDYEYKYKRTETLNGKECYVVGVIGKKKTEGYIKGTAWFETGSYNIVKLYGELYKQPKDVSESSMTMYFKEYDGHVMPSKIKFYAKATFLLFINKKIYITQKFSGYAFNNGLSDSLFK